MTPDKFEQISDIESEIDELLGKEDAGDFSASLEKINDKMADLQPPLNPDIVKEYGGYIDELLDFYYAQKDKQQDLEARCERDLTVKTYGRGGRMLHRGFHCPSPVMDWMIGGCSRGREVRKLNKEGGDYYIYYWDVQGKLMKIDRFCDSIRCNTEYLVEQGVKRYGITIKAWQGTDELEMLSMEEYAPDDRILKYIAILPRLGGRKNDHEIYSAEKYYYDDSGRLAFVTYARGNLRMKSLEEIKRRIIYGEDGGTKGYECSGKFYPGAKARR